MARPSDLLPLDALGCLSASRIAEFRSTVGSRVQQFESGTTVGSIMLGTFTPYVPKAAPAAAAASAKVDFAQTHAYMALEGHQIVH